MKKIKQYVATGVLAGIFFAAAPIESFASGYIITGSRTETQTITSTESPAMGSGTLSSEMPQLGSGANTESRNPQLGSGAKTEATGFFGIEKNRR